MCLSTITKKYKKNKEEGYGYKVFTKRNGKLYSDLKQTDIVRPINKWIKCKSMLIESAYGGTYMSGFHIFKNKENALNWFTLCFDGVIRKVKYKNIIVGGMQGCSGVNVIVAKEIKILPKIKRGK